MSIIISTREAYGKTLAEIGANPNIVVLDADLSKSTMTCYFKEKFPERFINCGIAEGNMMDVAAGIASIGKIVFASTFAMFAAGRAFEQIRNGICYPNLNVKVVATHAGVSVGEDGATHQCIEDIALMRAIPGMTVVSPADGTETEAVIKWAAQYEGPVYIRLGRLAVPEVMPENYRFEPGKATLLSAGNDISIVSTGLMTARALEAAEVLKKDGIDARVINVASIKPIDKEMIINAARETGGIVVAEEHNVFGGLGSAVAEVVAEHCPVKMRYVAVCDKFGQSGKAEDVLNYYGLTAENIIKKSKELLI